MFKRLWSRFRAWLGWETDAEYVQRKMLEIYDIPNVVDRPQAAELIRNDHRGTLRGFGAYLRLLGIPRAKIYEVTDAFTVIILVPSGTDPGLRDVIQTDYVPVTCQVVMFPTLGWWECRWRPYQPVPWADRLE